MWAAQYNGRVVLQDQERWQASNKSCYFLSTEERNNWWIKVENKFELK